MPGSDPISQLVGYVSIACWLGAQLPQIFENSRLQSCEGLSLPFLLNWYLGDCCNLLGCILTNQLPFQTLLASYFVCVDTALLFQYFYYTRPAKPSKHERAMSTSRATIRAERTPSRYRTISAVAANVAAAAALAAQHDEQGHTHRHPFRQRRHTELSQNASHGPFLEEEEEAPAKMMESFHSERGHTSEQKRVSWSIERHRPRGASLGSRSLLVSPDYITGSVSGGPDELEPDHATEQIPTPTLSLRRRSKSRKRGASLVFLGMWALFGIGGYATGGKNAPEPHHRLAVNRVVGISTISPTNIHSAVFLKNSVHDTLLQPSSEVFVALDKSQDGIERDFFRSAAGNDRFIGRIFAWLCTVLYLTSRLPQIWKNYVRKSVGGLSISLFICAFLGNTFYVTSIVISPRFYLPPPLSTEYIRESVPYLLGSGGTLMFDITIVTQFFLYRRKRRYSFVQERSEETALLSGSQPQYLVIDRLMSNSTMTYKSQVRRIANPTPYHLRTLVLDYLAHQCYTNTAKAFLRESAIKHFNADGDEVELPLSSNIDTAQRNEAFEEELNVSDRRQEVRSRILSGRIDDAQEFLNEYFPRVLSPDNDASSSRSNAAPCITRKDYIASHSHDPEHLTLNLRIQAFIEACRTVPLVHEPIWKGKNSEREGTFCVSEDQSPTQTSRMDEEQQMILLSKAQKLYALVNMISKPNDREQYREELKNVAGLLAYTVPEKSLMSRYLSQERREAVAEQINSAILSSCSQPVISTLELVTKQTTVAWAYANEHKAVSLPDAVIPPVKDFTLKKEGEVF
ncbi:PQ loop repeat domain containing protein [Amanita muscaria]